jgi:hypothetical protein
MTFPKSAKHIIEVAVINVELSFKMLLEIVDHHIFWGFLHFLEDFIHIVVMLRFLAKISMIVSVIEED